MSDKAYVLLCIIVFSCLQPSSSAASDRIVLECPDRDGLCTWDGEAWKPFWKAGTTEDLVAFEQIGARVAALLRGHMSPGRVVVLDGSGETIVVRHLATAYPLTAVVGPGLEGAVILCNGTLGESLCDTWLPNDGWSPRALMPWFPDNCLYPRSSYGGSFYCVEIPSEGDLRVRRIEDVRRPPIDIYISPDDTGIPDNFYAMGGDVTLFERDLQVLRTGGHGAEVRLSQEEVQWSRRVSSEYIAFAECSGGADGEVDDCSVRLVGRSGPPTVIWHSEKIWPADLGVLEEARLALQLRRGTTSALVVLGLEGGRWVEHPVWHSRGYSE